MSANIIGTSFKILISLLPQYKSHAYYCYANLLDTSSNVADMSRKWNAAENHSYACILFKAIILLEIRLHSIQHWDFRLPCCYFNFNSLKLFQLWYLKFLPLLFKSLQFCCIFVKPWQWMSQFSQLGTSGQLPFQFLRRQILSTI